MYYQTLLTLNKKYGEDIIQKYDSWLYNLPKREDDRISIGKVSNELQIEFVIAKNILEDSVMLNILKHRYAIRCPECGHVIEIVSIEDLYDKIKMIDICDACENEDIIITDEDIQVLYKKIEDGPKPEKQEKKLNEITKLSLNDTLKGFIEDKIIKANDIFYKPTPEEKENMVNLFNKIGEKSKNTTEQGNQLRNLAEYILRRVKLFEAANIRTATNELDCVVKNKLCFAEPYFINDLGSIIIVECKNEKKKPNNTYFLKLQGLLKMYKAKSGIIFAIQRPTKVVQHIANTNFLIDRTILISIDFDELRKVVYEDLNFLDLLENKILSLRTDATTYIDDNKVFEKIKT